MLEKLSREIDKGPATYSITIGDVFYIGGTRDLRQRILNHRSRLVRGAHWNGRLQEAFDRTGEFSVRIHDRPSAAAVRQAEQALLDLWSEDPNCVNLSSNARGSANPPSRAALVAAARWARSAEGREAKRKSAPSRAVLAVFPDGVEKWYRSIREAARQLDLEPRTLRTWLRTGKSPGNQLRPSPSTRRFIGFTFNYV